MISSHYWSSVEHALNWPNLSNGPLGGALRSKATRRRLIPARTGLVRHATATGEREPFDDDETPSTALRLCRGETLARLRALPPPAVSLNSRRVSSQTT